MPLNGNRHIPNVATPMPKEKHDIFEPGEEALRNYHLADDAQRFMIGPMPVQEFINTFLPKTNMRRMPSAAKAFDEVPASSDHKRLIYDAFINAINESSRCPGFVFKTTSQAETAQLRSLEPDICCFHQAAENLAVLDGESTQPAAPLDYAEIFIEMKRTPDHDFFKDPKPGEDRAKHKFILNIDNEIDLKKARNALGQNVAFASAICAQQLRLFCFSFSLSGSHLRFIRWDRAGAVVSESFDIRKKPKLLCEFLWRFSHASDAERGYDPTVEFPGAGDENRFHEAIRARVALETGSTGPELEDAVEEHYQPNTVTVVNIPDATGAMNKFLVSRPVISPRSIVSRATRGYWAVSSGNEVVFLKETWRLSHVGQEGFVLDELKTHDVENVPDMQMHGDVQSAVDHCTRADAFRHATWVCKGGVRVSMSHQLHYRIVLNTVGYTLKNFVNTKELLSAGYDAYRGMLSAYDKTNRLHRDISTGNIILVRVPGRECRKGILIDWEFSQTVDEMAELAAEGAYGRTGTWTFMSARILQHPKLPHTIHDDMESMLYVILYSAIRWSANNLSRSRLWTVVHFLFEKRDDTFGGTYKMVNLIERLFTKDLVFTSGPLHAWLDVVMRLPYPNRSEVHPDVDSKWEPAYVAEFWGRFLEEQAPNFAQGNEKVDNKIPRYDPHEPEPYVSIPFTKTMARPVESSPPSYNLRSKRKAENDSVEVEPQPAKRLRTQKPKPPPAAQAQRGKTSRAVAGPSGTQNQAVSKGTRAHTGAQAAGGTSRSNHRPGHAEGPAAVREGGRRNSNGDTVVPRRRVQPSRSCRLNTGR